MDKLFQNNSGEKSEHPSREMLLFFVDGELPSKEAAQLEAHLEACWPCRVKSKKIQEAIADIIEFDEQILTPRFLPPQGWRNFDRKLNELVAASGKQSFSSRLVNSLGRFLPSSHLLALPRPLLRPMVRNGAAVLMLILIVALVIRFKQEPTVSARELLMNALQAQSRQVHAINDPVVHQKLRVRRKTQVSTREESFQWEIWNDPKNSQVRQFLADGSEVIADATNATFGSDHTKETAPHDVLKELAQVLVANHMDPNHPLSATSYQAWHSTLRRQQDEVTRSKLSDGVDALRLHTIPAAPVNLGQIAEAIFVVRASDWQPTQLRLNVNTEGGNRIYELTQTISEVLSLAQLDPTIFNIASPSSGAAPKEVKKEGQQTPAVAANPRPLLPAPVATADLEVEALRLLNQVGADLGEQISVTRTTDRIQITGIVETDQRKSEIANALSPIASNPAIQIEIQTVAEAVAKQATTKATPSPSVQQFEILDKTMPAEPQVRTYFARKGQDTDEAVRQYAARMVSLSGQAMDHLWAMKRLLSQFSAEEIRSLTPEARAKWSGLMRTHAHSYKQNTESLRRELHPVLFPGQSLAAIHSDGAEIKDMNELSRVVEQLFELGSSNDRVIRSAFTSSTGGVMTTVITTPQFWQSLKSAEGLAARIVRTQ